MWGTISRALGVRPPPPKRGEALAVPVGMSRPAPGEPAHAAALLFSPAPDVKDDPVFLSRVQWRLMGLAYDGHEPATAAEGAVRDRFLGTKIDPKQPLVYPLPNGLLPTTPLWVANVPVTASLYEAGFDFGRHDGLLGLRYDLTKPAAEVLPDLPMPTDIARRRLDAMLTRDARFVWAELAQANYQLYQEGDASAACMVMLTFDFTVKPDELRRWCDKIYPLKFSDPEDPVLREAVWPLELSEQGWQYHRRLPLPKAMTGGRAVYLADLWVHRPFLDRRFPGRGELGDRPRRVPVLAESKEPGWAGVELVPFGETDAYRKRASRK